MIKYSSICKKVIPKIKHITHMSFLKYATLGTRGAGLARGEQGWSSGESARLPSMCRGFDSWTRRHTWVEFVVGSRPCSKGFSRGSPVFVPPQKSTLLNSNLIGNLRGPP